jgi:hypothetical protein
MAIHNYIVELRQVEDQFYRTILNDPETYMLGIQLVRAVADSLWSITDLATLIERLQRSSSEDVIAIADALEAPQVVLLDYQLALGAAFYLRAQEIQADQARAAILARLAEARAHEQPWVVLYEQETHRQGRTLFQRLEVHLPDGVGLRTASELDWEKGQIFLVEPLMLDLATGEIRGDAKPPEPSKQFVTYEGMVQAIEALKRKYG